MPEQPVIILGMHRSGTSLLSGILEEFGMFFGYRKEKNNESVFFMLLNQWILKQANASWDNPYNFRLTDNSFNDKLSHALEHMLASDDNKHFLGPQLSASCNDIRLLDIKWGWKDPRNTFTIDVWKRIFPNARLIHIYRNPVDVARSLRAREVEWQENTNNYLDTNGYSQIIRKNMQLQQSVRLGHIEEGIALWNDYIDKSLSLDREFGDRILHVRYEDLLSAPDRVIPGIVQYTGLHAAAEGIARCISGIDGSRKYAFTSDQELYELYLSIRSDSRLARLGYDNIAAG